MAKNIRGSILIVNFFLMIICSKRIKLLSTRIWWNNLTPPPLLTGVELWDRVLKFPKSADHCGKTSMYGVSHN